MVANSKLMNSPQKTSATLYGFSGKFAAKQGQGSTLADILMQAAGMMTDVAGCRLYIVSLDAQNPDMIHIFETWDTKEAHDNALTGPAVKALIAKAMPLIDGKPETQVLQTLGGLGLYF